MNEVKRYRFKGAAGEYVYANDFDAAQSELAALREELAAEKERSAQYGRSFNETSRKLNELQPRLTAAEQRNAELEKRAADLSALPVIANALKEREDAIELLRQNMHHSRGGTRHAIEASTQKFLDSLCLKPTESGASE